ncbi:MAG: C40 family peptidase [Deltaproteobacteria bacterium]|nr:C40 family peptidase [Deltaproteobacteria bacterium]
MRASLVLACVSVVLVGCEQRGYAPAYPAPGVYPGYVGYPGASPYGQAPVYPSWNGSSPGPETKGYGNGGMSPSHRGAYAAQVAMSFHGRPYCWGGAGPECFDCSGLTYTSWRAAGRTIPRTSELQREKLAPVPMHALEPGDILWRPGHVGLYVGNGWVIHAPGAGKPVQYQAAAKFVEALRPR